MNNKEKKNTQITQLGSLDLSCVTGGDCNCVCGAAGNCDYTKIGGPQHRYEMGPFPDGPSCKKYCDGEFHGFCGCYVIR